jgi:ATP-dependent Clp protease ATP-binding subunit ClpA
MPWCTSVSSHWEIIIIYFIFYSCFTYLQVSGDTSGPIVGPSLVSIFDNAKKYKKEFNDDFVSVEHFLLAFTSDKRFGQQLLKDLQLDENKLKEAVKAVRGNQRVTDQSMAHIFCLLVVIGMHMHL